MAYNELIKDTVIIRSMSRAGKPTDNPVNESINGWMKEELYMDIRIDECRSRDEFMAVLERYVDFYNHHRPCYALGYDTPVNYRKRYNKALQNRKTPNKTIEKYKIKYSKNTKCKLPDKEPSDIIHI